MSHVLTVSFTTQNGNAGFGGSGASTQKYRSQSFATAAGQTKISQVENYLRHVAGKGSTGTLTCHIYSNSGGNPSSSLGSANHAAITEDSYDWIDFVFSTPITVTANTTYHIVMMANSAGDDNTVQWGYDSAQGYADGTGKKSADLSSWTTESLDHDFKIYKLLITSDQGLLID